ncbi:tripartite tricarboxylate transporter substrate binding protein [Verminephrobacter eiseniae]|nr:tripartite tricarboxylate transporter substrate binding protein [Verminephrobacter eiseniae]
MMPHRPILALAFVFALSPMAAPAQTDSWPSGPVQVVVPFGAGGGTTDPLARIVAEELGKQFGVGFVVANKPGANGNLGAVFVKRSAPNGQTLLFTGAGTLATNPAMYKDPGFDTKADFEPVVVIASVANILVVNPSIPATTVKEFVAYLNKYPDKVSFGSTGNGSSMHTAGELFRQKTSTSMVHVPYNSAGAATTDLISGNIQAMFQLVPGISGFIANKKVTALAVMSPQRSATVPDVPTMAEAGFPSLVSYTWLCLMAPKGTPKPVIDRLNEGVNKLLAQPAFRARLAAMGVEPMGGTPAEFSAFLDAEISKWGDVVKSANIAVQ